MPQQAKAECDELSSYHFCAGVLANAVVYPAG